MSIRRHIIILLLSLLMPICVSAQESTIRQILNEAESEYELGRIEQAHQLLSDHLSEFQGIQRQSAYRLLALCCLSEDREEEAKYYAQQLVKMNNYYNSADDPARFQDLISQLKEGVTTTITTASSQSETINEAPAPITIITSDMIEELGYNKSLAQILAAYVPGMAEVSSVNEGENLSMHSAYTKGQFVILIMENGHRLNNHYDNNGPVSYSISTEKIDHIEVVRGPASSLYGNVALSAVVNIITKSGKDINGVKAKYGYGTFNTHRADITMGTQFMDADIFAWASLYNSDGQIRHIADGEGYLKDKFAYIDGWDDYQRTYYSPDQMYIDGYSNPPSYDVGLTLKLKGFDLAFSRKNVKKILKATLSRGGYDYDRYAPINGIMPGYGTESTHMELGYTRQLKNWNLHLSTFCDWITISNYIVEYDSMEYVHPLFNTDSGEYIEEVDENGNKIYETECETGSLSFEQLKEQTMGGSMRVSTAYHWGNMRGYILTGIQYEYFSLKSRSFLFAMEFERISGGNLSYDSYISGGKEKNLSFFLQDKHYFLPQLILNAGFRYDLKYHQDLEEPNSFSPRLALMYVPNDQFSLRLSYSEAFANLSFYDRYYSNNGTYTLNPQHLSALQLTAMGTLPQQHFNYEVNLFYNNYSNLICWDERTVDWNESYGKNRGQLENVGIECTAAYSHKRLSARMTLYYCHDINIEHFYYNTKEKIVNNVPHFIMNLNGSWKLLKSRNHELKFYGHASYTGRKLVYADQEEHDFYVASKLLFDLGTQYRYKQCLQLSLDVENILNTDHYICGNNNCNAPVLQRGRTLMASVSFQL